MGGYHFTCTARLPWIVQAPPGEHSITGVDHGARFNQRALILHRP
jgi:hypothetical protein